MTLTLILVVVDRQGPRVQEERPSWCVIFHSR